MPMANYISPLSNDSLSNLCKELGKNNSINPADFERYSVKRGLRNQDGTGVMAGLTRICNVQGYYVSDGERVPVPGRLIYRGIDLLDLVHGCEAEDRFGYEEVAWLLLFGTLPTQAQLTAFTQTLAQCRELPEDFIEDMIMKAPSPDIMNKLARCVLALYSYDEQPDDISIENVLRQSIQLVAQLPTIMSYAYQVKRRHYYHKSMYIHPIRKEHTTAQFILNSIRSDRKFTDEEAKLLDLCLMLHAEHGGGNNSTFSTRVLTSSGTDTYSAIAAGIGSLKGPRHGGANIKVTQMLDCMEQEISDLTDEGQVADFLKRIIHKQAGDHSGLIYGMGHAVYTLSDPRAVLLKEQARKFASGTEFEEKFRSIELVERLTPEIFAREKGTKSVCAPMWTCIPAWYTGCSASLWISSHPYLPLPAWPAGLHTGWKSSSAAAGSFARPTKAFLSPVSTPQSHSARRHSRTLRFMFPQKSGSNGLSRATGWPSYGSGKQT